MKTHKYSFYRGGIIKFLIALACLTSTASYGEVIFSDNFDATPDWQNVGSQRCNWIGWDKDTGDTSCANVPRNFDLMYMDERNKTTPMCSINSQAARGASGKGLKVTDESNGSSYQWGSDCQLAKVLPKQFPEVWASFYIHYNPNMNWGKNQTKSKIFRIGHYNPFVINGTTRTSVFNTNGDTSKGPTTSGLVFFDIKSLFSTGARMRFQQSTRCANNYKCGDYKQDWETDIIGKSDYSWKNTLGDNQWHHIEIRVKMNSFPGAGDGIFEQYFDGVLQTKRADIPWRMAGVDPSVVTGFNMFTIAGNSSNIWAGTTNEEQWMYDIDDVMICTSRCSGSPPLPPTIAQ